MVVVLSYVAEGQRTQNKQCMWTCILKFDVFKTNLSLVLRTKSTALDIFPFLARVTFSMARKRTTGPNANPFMNNDKMNMVAMYTTTCRHFKVK